MHSLGFHAVQVVPVRSQVAVHFCRFLRQLCDPPLAILKLFQQLKQLRNSRRSNCRYALVDFYMPHNHVHVRVNIQSYEHQCAENRRQTDVFVVIAGNHRRPCLLLVNRSIDFVNSLRRDGIEFLKNT